MGFNNKRTIIIKTIVDELIKNGFNATQIQSTEFFNPSVSEYQFKGDYQIRFGNISISHSAKASPSPSIGTIFKIAIVLYSNTYQINKMLDYSYRICETLRVMEISLMSKKIMEKEEQDFTKIRIIEENIFFNENTSIAICSVDCEIEFRENTIYSDLPKDEYKQVQGGIDGI